jgi:CelD/BcsL family acetyltransferase involved in cellulose biosynthesis
MIKVRLIPADQLTAAEVAAWSEILRETPALDSPYFRPEYTLAVAAVRGDVEVGVLRQGAAAVGFFPFQRGPGEVARPVGGILSDFHGVIAREDTSISPLELLHGCRITAWHFDHLLASQTSFGPYHWRVAPSPYIDLAGGWEGYQAQQRKLHSSYFKRALRKIKFAQREAGPLRVELDSRDPTLMGLLFKWKREQYRRTGMTDVLAADWTRVLLRRITAERGEDFAGITSALYLGGMPAAVLFSMRSGAVLHAWFSAYHPDFAQLSPGLVLWLELARLMPEIGVRRIDLGKGPEEYKTHLMSGATDVAEGSVDLRPLTAVARRGLHRACDWARQSPLRRPLLVPGRAIRRIIQTRNLRQ